LFACQIAQIAPLLFPLCDKVFIGLTCVICELIVWVK
jgi:hypothetical protein